MLSEDGNKILTNIKKVAAGTIHTLVLTEEGTAYAVGYSGYGQLGNGTNKTQMLPVKMIDKDKNVVKNIKDIAANGYSSMVYVKDTSVENTQNDTNKHQVYMLQVTIIMDNYLQKYNKTNVFN